MTERELLHKWLGGLSGMFIDRVGRRNLIEILETCERRRPYSWPYPFDEKISLCRGCYCMTHTNPGPNGESYCGKCGALKPIQKSPEKPEIYTKPSEPIQVNPKSHHYMEPSNG